MAQTTVTAEKGTKIDNEITEMQGKVGPIIAEAQKQMNQASVGLPVTGDPVKTRKELVAVLKEINGKFKKYNDGKDPVEIPKDNVALTTGIIASIETQVRQAFANASGKKTGEIAGEKYSENVFDVPDTTLKATPSKKDTSATVITQPQQSTAAMPLTTVPIQQLTQTERDAYLQIMDNLKTISNSGASTITTQTKKTAGALHDEINTEITKLSGSQTAAATSSITALRNMKKGYEKTFAAALKAAQDAALTKTSERGPELRGQMGTLLKDLRGMEKTAGNEASATAILNMLPNVWLLSEDEKAQGATPGTGPRWKLFQTLQYAAANLKTGDVKTAGEQYAQAVKLFKREQALLGQRADRLLERIESTVVAITSSSLPTRAELSQNKCLFTSLKKIQNGKEDLKAAMLSRQNQLTELTLNERGVLSYNHIADLEQTVRLESSAINSLIALWDCSSARLVSADRTTKQTAWNNYAIAAATLADPDPKTAINPYEKYPEELRNFIISQYKRAINSKMSDKDAIAALMRNMQLKYDDVLYATYKYASRTAPASTGVEKEVKTLAELRTLKILCEYDYEQYLYVTENDAIVNIKLEDASYYLKTAVNILTASGVSPTGLLATTAYAWLDKMEDIPASLEGKKALADAYKSMAMNLVAIREAEIWSENVATVGNPAATGAMKAYADDIIAGAREEFKWAFSVPETNGAYYNDLPGNIADLATRILAPAGLAVTEAHARYEAVFRSEQEKTEVGTVMDNARDDKKEPNTVDLLKAQLRDRNAAMTAGVEAEKGHINLLISVRGNKDFERPYAIVGDDAIAFGMVSPNNGRLQQNEEPPRPRPTVSRADGNFDHRHRAHERPPSDQRGYLPNEIYRQGILKNDNNAPPLLKQLDVGAFDSTADDISLRYGDSSVTPQTQRGEANRAFMMILDARIAELEARLSGSVEAEVKGRKVKIPIIRFATSEDPRKYFVVRAQEALEDAKLLRQKFDTTTYMFGGTYEKTPKQGIMSVEQAIASLSDGNFVGKDGKLLFQPGASDELTAVVGENDVSIIKTIHARGTDAYAVPLNFGIIEGDKKYGYAEYAKKSPNQMLRFNWFWYQEMSGQQFLLNPKYKADQDHRYIGVVMDSVILTNGTKLGRAVVRVEPTHQPPTKGAPFAPVLQKNQKVEVKDVLYLIKPGTELEPLNDATLNANLDQVVRVKVASAGDIAKSLEEIAQSGHGSTAKGSDALKKQSPGCDAVTLHAPTRAVLLVKPLQME